jgi:hypothetical protein
VVALFDMLVVGGKSYEEEKGIYSGADFGEKG